MRAYVVCKRCNERSQRPGEWLRAGTPDSFLVRLAESALAGGVAEGLSNPSCTRCGRSDWWVYATEGFDHWFAGPCPWSDFLEVVQIKNDVEDDGCSSADVSAWFAHVHKRGVEPWTDDVSELFFQSRFGYYRDFSVYLTNVREMLLVENDSELHGFDASYVERESGDRLGSVEWFHPLFGRYVLVSDGTGVYAFIPEAA